MLHERECAALRTVARAKILFLSLACAVVVPLAGSSQEMAAILALSLVYLGTWLPALRGLGRGQVMTLLGAITDAAALCALPAIWHLVYIQPYEPLVHLLRHNLTSVSIVFIAVNGLTFSPICPAVVTSAAVVLQLGLAILAVKDPRLSS